MVCPVLRTITQLELFAETTMWVDKEQLDLFILEYNHSSDKQRFLGEKRNQCSTICRVHLIYLLFINPPDWLLTAREQVQEVGKGRGVTAPI